MHPDVKRVMSGKRILLFKEMLRAAGMPNIDVLIDFMVSGFPVAGSLATTGVFPSVVRDASMQIEDLYKMKSELREQVLASCRSSGDEEIDKRLHQITGEEIEKGWLVGPLTREQLDGMGL